MTNRLVVVASPRDATIRGCLLSASLVAACGAPPTSSEAESSGTATATATSSTDSLDSVSTSADSSTGAQTGCWRHVDGDFRVDDDTDLGEVGEIASVSGTLSVAFTDRELEDLSFLGCLEQVGILDLQWCPGMVSTGGMASLRELDALWVDCGVDRIEGFDAIERLEGFGTDSAHMGRIDLHTVRSIGVITIGRCEDGLVPADPLHTLGEFDALAEVDYLWVHSQPSVADVSILDALIANDAPPMQEARFVKNPSISEAEILEKLDSIGTVTQQVCGNLGGAPCEECPPPS